MRYFSGGLRPPLAKVALFRLGMKNPSRTSSFRRCQDFSRCDEQNAEKGKTAGRMSSVGISACNTYAASYNGRFHGVGCASVAQWQSSGFVNRWLWVRLPPLASRGKTIHGQVAERPMASDCKSDGFSLRGFKSLPAHSYV